MGPPDILGRACLLVLSPFMHSFKSSLCFIFVFTVTKNPQLCTNWFWSHSKAKQPTLLLFDASLNIVCKSNNVGCDLTNPTYPFFGEFFY